MTPPLADDALRAEAEAEGLKFFDHCRAKLLANMTTPAPERAVAPPVERTRSTHAVRDANVAIATRPEAVGGDDRIGRLEPGYAADVVLLDAPDWRHVAYHLAGDVVDTVVEGGAVAFRRTA